MTPTIYHYISGTPSKPEKAWLGFNNQEEADKHAARMNKFLDDYDDAKAWNHSIWPTKPEPWVVKENPEYLAVAVEAVVK